MAEEHHLHEHDKAEAVAVIEFASDALEKAVAQEVGGLNESDQPEYHDKETQRVIRKVDWRLVPMLTSLYLLAFLDRSNIGNAHAAGMLVTLNMTDHQYDMVLTMFFLTYAPFEVPSNIVLKLMKPSTWIMILMICWGIVMTCQGLVRDYHELLVTRILLGLFESGFFPAASYLLTTWYCRFEVQTRLAVFFSAASLAGAFSGLLAYGIEFMGGFHYKKEMGEEVYIPEPGVGGYEGWRWIFILEGLLTVALGCTIHWTLPDSPASASFLTTHEKGILERRLMQDSGTKEGHVNTHDHFQWKFLKAAFSEWRIYLGVIVFWGDSICLYGFTYSAPSIIEELGYETWEAQLLTVPIYVLGAISTVFFSWYADRKQIRWPSIVIPYSIAACCMIALLAIPHPRLPGLTYAFLFGIPAGVYPPLIALVAWFGNNLAPTWKRAVGMATLISIGNFGGAIGSNIYLSNEAPNYWLGFGFSLGILLAAIASTMILRSSYLNENARRDRMTKEEIMDRYTEAELLDMGDKSPLYRYVV